MAEFDDKLSSILSNPDAMAQIMQLAQSISGGADAISRRIARLSMGISHGTGTTCSIPRRRNPLRENGVLDPPIIRGMRPSSSR